MRKITTEEIDKWLDENQTLMNDLAKLDESLKKTEALPDNNFGDEELIFPVEDINYGIVLKPDTPIPTLDSMIESKFQKYYNTKEGNKKEYKRRRSPKNRWIRARYDAKRRSTGVKEFSITLEEYLEFIKQPCYYCNSDISNSSGSGMDRIDNKKGYSLDNVNPCCQDCNRRRGDTMSAEEFKKQSFINGYWKETNENK